MNAWLRGPQRESEHAADRRSWKERIDELFDQRGTLFFFLYLGIAFGIGVLACILGY